MDISTILVMFTCILTKKKVLNWIININNIINIIIKNIMKNYLKFFKYILLKNIIWIIKIVVLDEIVFCIVIYNYKYGINYWIEGKINKIKVIGK